MSNGLKDDGNREDVQDLRWSLEFNQTNITAIESKLDAANIQIILRSKAVKEHVQDVGSLHEQIEYRIVGVDEVEDETWEKLEEVVKKLVNDILELTDELQIERAQRVWKKRNEKETRQDGSKYGPRPIVAKFLS